jgi:hypothetical protein
LGLDGNITLNDLAGLDFGSAGPSGAGLEQYYAGGDSADPSERAAQPTPGASPRASATPPKSPEPAALSELAMPELLYGPYYNTATGRFDAGSGRFADLARKYGVAV